MDVARRLTRTFPSVVEPSDVPTRLPRLAVAASAVAVVLGPTAASAAPTDCTPTWTQVGSSAFQGADALIRSQGVTTDGSGWFFSWQGGLQRTRRRLHADGGRHAARRSSRSHPRSTRAAPTTSATTTSATSTTTTGLIYAPVEDGGESAGRSRSTTPSTRRRTSRSTTRARSPTRGSATRSTSASTRPASRGWRSTPRRREVYTAEWDMPHDRLNVFDPQMHFKRFLAAAVTRASLGPGFHLSRIQGAKVYGHTLYATRDDADKTVFSIDLRSGEVTKLFSLKPGVLGRARGLRGAPHARRRAAARPDRAEQRAPRRRNPDPCRLRALRASLTTWVPGTLATRGARSTAAVGGRRYGCSGSSNHDPLGRPA